MIKRLTILNVFLVIGLLANAQVKDTVIKSIGRTIDSLQQRPVNKKITVDSSLYLPMQVSQKTLPVIKSDLKSKEIKSTVRPAKVAILFAPYYASKDTFILNKSNDVSKEIQVEKKVKEIQVPKRNQIVNESKEAQVIPKNKIVIESKQLVLPESVKMINLLALDSIRQANAIKRITIDSSVFQNQSIVKSSSAKFKTDSTINHFNHILIGKKQSVVLVPAIKEKFIKPIANEFVAKEESVAIKMKNLLELDSLYKKNAVEKITLDSLVYKKYLPVKNNLIVQTNLKSREITGTILPKNKNRYFVPLAPKIEVPIEQKIITPVVEQKNETKLNQKEVSPFVEQKSKQKVEQRIIVPIVEENTLKENNIEVASAVSKKVLDSLNNFKYAEKITIDSSVYVPKKVIDQNNPIVKTELRSQEITGTITPKNKNRNIVPSIPKPIVQKPIFVAKPESESKSPLETLDTNLIVSKKGNTEIVKTNLRSKKVAGTIIPDKKSIAIVPEEPKKDSLLQQQNDVEAMNTNPITTASDELPPLTGEIPKTNFQSKNVGSETTLDPTKFYSLPSNKNFGNLDNSISSENNFNNNLPIKTDLKSQTVTTGTLLPRSGQPIIVQPITLDSIAAMAAASNANSAVQIEPPLVSTDIVNKNPTNSRTKIVNNNSVFQKEISLQKIDLTRNKNSYSAPSYSISGMKYNFYLSQNGKYAISFYTRDFYLNISQNGQLSDLSVVQSGKVSNASISRVSRVGNLNVNYNEKGQMNAINDVAIDYSYDGKVSKIGDVPINYTYDGLIDKVGDVKIYYNTNGSVYIIDKFKVTYNYDGIVDNIDDSKGLIIYKPQIK